jgi:hypothetical protein
MWKAISRANFQRSSATHFGTLPPPFFAHGGSNVVAEKKDFQIVQPNERTNTVGNRVGNKILLSIPDKEYGQSVRIGAATAVVPTRLLVIEKNEMIRVLHAEHAFFDRFVSYIRLAQSRICPDLDSLTVRIALCLGSENDRPDTATVTCCPLPYMWSGCR